jgi:hypothetical protein
MLSTCAVLIASIVGLLLGAHGGLWQLPPAATAMLRRETVLHPPTIEATKPATSIAAADPATPNGPPATVENPQAATPTPAIVDPPALIPTSALAAPIPAPIQEPTAATPEPPPSAAAVTTPPLTDEPTAAALEPPPNAAAAEPLSDDETSAAIPAAASSAKLLQLARSRQQAGDLAAAESLLRRALAKDPDDHHAIEALVRVLIARGRGPEALRYAEEIVHKRPRRASYRVLDGDAKLLTGDKAGAESAWREALAMEPDNREAKRRLASLP